jgi:hypothetical protein
LSRAACSAQSYSCAEHRTVICADFVAILYAPCRTVRAASSRCLNVCAVIFLYPRIVASILPPDLQA